MDAGELPEAKTRFERDTCEITRYHQISPDITRSSRFGDVLGRWKFGRRLLERTQPGHFVESPSFAFAGLDGLQLRLYPKGELCQAGTMKPKHAERSETV